ncbi:MAG: hypothetical protein H0W48_00455 [Methylibium sp.]|nr:hypothetical protein [Methylibium sp.]
MGWTHADWPTATLAWAIAAVSTSDRRFTVAGDRRAYLRPGEVVAVVGANIGSYTVAAVAYEANATAITVAEAIPSATVEGTLAVGNAAVRLDRLLSHIAEVSAEVSAAVGSRGTSLNAETLRAYLKDILLPERNRLQRQVGGVVTRGRLVNR